MPFPPPATPTRGRPPRLAGGGVQGVRAVVVSAAAPPVRGPRNGQRGGPSGTNGCHSHCRENDFRRFCEADHGGSRHQAHRGPRPGRPGSSPGPAGGPVAAVRCVSVPCSLLHVLFSRTRLQCAGRRPSVYRLQPDGAARAGQPHAAGGRRPPGSLARSEAVESPAWTSWRSSSASSEIDSPDTTSEHPVRLLQSVIPNSPAHPMRQFVRPLSSHAPRPAASHWPGPWLR
jgi:hypothetical protein